MAFLGFIEAYNDSVGEETQEWMKRDEHSHLNPGFATIQQISQLIYRGIDLHQHNFEYFPATILWLMSGCHPKVLQQLADLGTDFFGIDTFGFSFFQVACVRGTVASLKLLLQQGADPHITEGPEESSCLQLSVLNDTPAVLTYLLEIGSPTNETNRDGDTALHDAAAFGPAEYIDILIQHGADRSLLNTRGLRPFNRAIYNRQLKDHITTLKKLQHNNSDIDLRDVEGHTPLHMAASCSAPVVVK